MKIDWKYVATTEGYKSLKAAYIHDVQESEEYRRKRNRKPMREKAEFLKLFNWVIARATHHAYCHEVCISSILTHWESKRTYWWLNYYGNSSGVQSQHKHTSGVLKQMGINGWKKANKTGPFSYNDPVRRKNNSCKYIMRKQRHESTKSPIRWDNARKKRAKYFRDRKQSL